MNAKELKVIAVENGVEFQQSYSAKKMEEILKEAGIEVKVEASHQDLGSVFRGRIQEVAKEYKGARTQIEIKRAKQAVLVLRREIKESEDINSLVTLLKWERSRKLISVQDDYLLNQMEMDNLPDDRVCICKTKLPGSGIRAVVGTEYKYFQHYDENYINKATKVPGNNFFTFYVPKVISGDEQIDEALASKIKRGFHPEAKDYKEDRILINKYTLIESEFEKYFDIEDETEIIL